MKFEIINPSDEAYIEGDFKICCLATLFFGDGKYGLQQVGGDLTMPILFFEPRPDEWFKSQFGKPLKELLDEVSKEELGKALLSVKLARKRTSLNDFTSYANALGRKLIA